MYSWVPTHKAIAQKLLQYEERQQELIDILKDVGETIINDVDAEGHRIALEDIEPFTFFCYIYKYGPEKRLQRLRQIAARFNIEPLPEDEKGLPSANAQKVWLFPYKKERSHNEVARLWRFFRAAMGGQITNELFSDILNIKNTGKTKITEALFYVDPERYLPVNTQTRPYLDEVMGLDPDFETWKDYEQLLKRVRCKTDEPFYKISHDAWVWNTEAKHESESGVSEKPSSFETTQDSKQFPLHELALTEVLANIGQSKAIRLFYEKMDALIESAEIVPEQVHGNVRSESRIVITLGRRYTLTLKRREDSLYWMLLLSVEDEDAAKSSPGFDSSGYFNDGDGESDYCWVQFVTALNEPEPLPQDIWDKWSDATGEYYREVKGSKQIRTYKRFTNQAVIKSLFDKEYRKALIGKSEAFRTYAPQKRLVERYKALLKFEGLLGEEYKWKLLGKKYWDLEAEDFVKMMKAIPFKNLVYKLTVGVLHHIATEFPAELKEILKKLFDEESPLDERIKVFRSSIESLYRRVEPKLSAHQDERAASVYLAFYSPDKYPLYKNSYYSRYCTLLNRRQARTNEKYQDYILLLDDLIQTYIKTDPELLELIKQHKPEGGYDDANYLITAQDILYRVLEHKRDRMDEPGDYEPSKPEVSPITEEQTPSTVVEENDPDEVQPDAQNYWWLNANPGIWSINDLETDQKQTYTSRNEKGNKRRIYKHFETAQPGDLMIGYESSPTKQIKAILSITKALHHSNGREVIEFEMIEKLNVPVDWNDLLHNPALENCEVFRNNQGSLFRLTEEEFDVIREVIDNKNIVGSIHSDTSKTEVYSYEEDQDKPFITPGDFRRASELLRRKKNIILQGPPGVGKTFIARKLAYELMGHKNDANIEMVQFHQSFSYEDFIQGLRPGRSNFELKNGVFYTFCKKAHAHPGRQFFFVIDEINRGNLSKIFGEVMMLIEPDKRSEKYALKLTYAEDEHDRFYIPDNMHIIGTMNTADRSLAIVDYALRRRFAFITLKPNYERSFQQFLLTKGISQPLVDHIIKNVGQVNMRIKEDVNLGEGFQIGHSYFCSYPGRINESEWYNEVILFEIKPLLEEIWFDNSDLAAQLVKDLLL